MPWHLDYFYLPATGFCPNDLVGDTSRRYAHVFQASLAKPNTRPLLTGSALNQLDGVRFRCLVLALN